jgi:hypothetical protein
MTAKDESLLTDLMIAQQRETYQVVGLGTDSKSQQRNKEGKQHGMRWARRNIDGGNDVKRCKESIPRYCEL